jgi:transposase
MRSYRILYVIGSIAGEMDECAARTTGTTRFSATSGLTARFRRTIHPLRPIRRITDIALASLSDRFDAMYSEIGRPSIPPEKLLRALLPQAFYSIRSERQLMEQMGYNLLFRWFVGLSVDEPVWVPTVFSKNRERVLEGDIAAAFMDAVLNQDEVKFLLSAEHFSVDGTLIQAWASMKSFRRKEGKDEPPGPGRDGTRDFHKEKRSNGTHASTTLPDARLTRKGAGKEAKLSFTGHLLMENRNGLVVDTRLTPATGTAEREAAIAMLNEVPGRDRVTVGADKAYDTADFIAHMRAMKVTPHVAQNINAHRGPNIDARTTRQARYEISQVIRKRIEEANGWIKTVGGMARTLHRGRRSRAVDVSISSHRLRSCPATKAARHALNPSRARIEVPSSTLRRREKP